MKLTIGLLAGLTLLGCGEGPSSAPPGHQPMNGGQAGSGAGPAPSSEPLDPATLDQACTVDAPSPRRLLRLAPEELLQSFSLAGAPDPASLPAAWRADAIPDAPTAGLAVTRDFHLDVDRVATELAKTYAPTLSCDRALFGSDPECTSSFLETEGVRLLRGRRDETLLASVKALAADVATRSGGVEALQYSVRALLLSPASLYMTEGFDGTKDPTGATVLSPVELASYLSFRVHGRPPSPGLLAALESTPGVGIERLTQILSSEISASSAELTARFLTSFLQVEGIGQLSRDPTKHPQADGAFLQQLQSETLQAVLAFANDSAATFSALLTRPQQSALLGDAAEASYARWGRPGVFALPGIIAATSAADHTNVPRRGRFLLKNLFCESLQSPPPGAAQQEPPQVPGESERARFERVGQVGGCGGCHARLHPLAFAFEAYDELGAVREQDTASNPVFAASEFVVSGGATLSFDGPSELMQAVAREPAAQNCFVLQTYRFVARRDERGAHDACLIKGIAERARSSELRLGDLALSALAATALAPRN